MHFRNLCDNQNNEEPAIYHNVEGFVISHVAGYPCSVWVWHINTRGYGMDDLQNSWHQHHKLLCGRPGSACVNLLVNSKSIVLSLCSLIGTTFDPMQ
jgi:hypothetical protein